MCEILNHFSFQTDSIACSLEQHSPIFFPVYDQHFGKKLMAKGRVFSPYNLWHVETSFVFVHAQRILHIKKCLYQIIFLKNEG